MNIRFSARAGRDFADLPSKLKARTRKQAAHIDGDKGSRYMKTVFAVVFWSIVIGTIAGLAITTEPQKVAVTPPLDERAQKDAIARQHAYQEAASAAQDVRRYVENARREHCLPIATLLEAAFCKSLDDIERKINSAGY